jgi:protein MpaA
MRVLLAVLCCLLLAGCAPERSVIGHSADGRPITSQRLGAARPERTLLVVGCIHGTECAGMRIVRALRHLRPPPGVALWLVPTLDPDGLRLGTRLNGRGVDLNRNFPAGWRPIGRRFDQQYSGPRPLSEPESRAAAALIRRIRPDVTIWYHQALDRVWAWGPSRAAGRRYATAAGMRFAPRPWLAGTAPHWQNAALGLVSFVVELPAGRLSASAAARHARAALASLG